MKKDIEIISVNFNTPDLIDRLITTTRVIEGDYPIRIIDGSDREPYKSEIVDVCDGDGIELVQFNYNVHHGKGMDYGVSTSKYKWVLILDSDNYFMANYIDKMMEYVMANDKKICAYYCHTNEHGIGYGREWKETQQILYYHPMLFLINVEYYKSIKEMGVTFIHHGAPCIEINKYLHQNNLSDVVGCKLHEAIGIEERQYKDYINFDSRGTRQRFGMSL